MTLVKPKLDLRISQDNSSFPCWYVENEVDGHRLYFQTWDEAWEYANDNKPGMSDGVWRILLVAGACYTTVIIIVVWKLLLE